MTAAEKRVAELLDRWLASVELHQRYLALDETAYARAEKWPKHQRPTAFIVDLARQRVVELRAHLTRRRDTGDEAFAEALELMSFLTSLLGSEHIERYLPLATGRPPDTAVSATVQQPRLKNARLRTGASGLNRQLSGSSPRQAIARKAPSQRQGSGSASASTGTSQGARAVLPKRPGERSSATSTSSRGGERSAPATRPGERSSAASPSSSSSVRTAMVETLSKRAAREAIPAGSPDARSRQVIADAVRMLQWGNEWPVLAGLIARMADRPVEAEVWKILRTYRTQIQAKAQRPSN